MTVFKINLVVKMKVILQAEQKLREFQGVFLFHKSIKLRRK
jgi:hypothetical protein